MSEILTNQPVQPITPFRSDDSERIITPTYYSSVLPQLERLIVTEAKCKGMGPELFTEYQYTVSVEQNKQAIETCNDCAVKDLCRNWAIAERLTGVIAGGEKTKTREKTRKRLNLIREQREGEVEPAKAEFIRHALKNRALYLGMLSAYDRENCFF